MLRRPTMAACWNVRFSYALPPQDIRSTAMGYGYSVACCLLPPVLNQRWLEQREGHLGSFLAGADAAMVPTQVMAAAALPTSTSLAPSSRYRMC
jgi:hypothetical protein